MDRRDSLATLLGQKKAKHQSTSSLSATFLNTGLEPYSGEWTFEQAAHLLRRATFAPTYAQIKQAVDMGMEATLSQLFADIPLPDAPIYYDEEEDPNAPLGTTWINAPYSNTQNYKPARARSLRAWIMINIMEEGISIREKLTLFWHNHFAVNNVNDPKYIYRYLDLIRRNAWGNFRELVKNMTVEPAMLRFLNGNQNTAVAPNENYARELLELFTIGKGPLAGPDDYTNYTEVDVLEIARVLTGWRDRGFNTNNAAINIEPYFTANRHDQTSKQLSHRFNNTVINNQGDSEYADLIDIIFQQKEVSRFICRKLYRWFIYYKIDDNAEVNVIEPMADLLIENNFEIKAVLQTLLRSEHFYDILSVGPMIKNPVDFVIAPLKQMQVSLPKDNLPLYYAIMVKIYSTVTLMEMDYINPPQVAGWKAYYQEPQFYRTWINATTLQQRMGYTNKVATFGFTTQGEKTRINPLEVIKLVDKPTDPNAVIDEFAKIWFPQPLTDSQKVALKDILIPGLPDFEWTVEYGQYAADPDNRDLADAVNAKLRDLIQAMMSMAEYYLS
ncbi:MAG: DUF1800 domain-containing protein [Saprospiraceae bacterium]